MYKSNVRLGERRSYEMTSCRPHFVHAAQLRSSVVSAVGLLPPPGQANFLHCMLVNLAFVERVLISSGLLMLIKFNCRPDDLGMEQASSTSSYTHRGHLYYMVYIAISSDPEYEERSRRALSL